MGWNFVLFDGILMWRLIGGRRGGSGAEGHICGFLAETET